MYHFRILNLALLGVLCLTGMLACGGGGGASTPGQPQFLGFLATGETDPIWLTPNGATITVEIPAPAGSASSADSLTVDWGDASPTDFFDLRAISGWPFQLTHQYLSAGSHFIAVDLRAGAAIIAHGEQRISILPNVGPELCGKITPVPINRVIEGWAPLEVHIDARCTEDPDPFFSDAITFDVDYGDGEVLHGLTAAELNAHRKLYAGGGYLLRITAFDREGASSDLNLVISSLINRPPDIDLRTVPIVVDSVILFPKVTRASTLTLDLSRSTDQESFLPDVGLISIDWGDGSVPIVNAHFLDLAVAVHQYQSPGIYPLVLSLSEGDNTVTREITVEKPVAVPPIACGAWDPPASPLGVVTGIVPFSPELDLSCSFDPDSDFLATGRISVVFGDGPKLIDEPFATYAESLKKPYTQEGTYTHVVTLIDELGNESEPFVTTIEVLPIPPNQLPVAIIGTDTQGGPAPLTVQFSSADSFDPDGSITSTVWNFNDPGVQGGGVSVEPNPSHLFEIPATCQVSLLVVDNSGLGNPLDRTSDTIIIEVTD